MSQAPNDASPVNPGGPPSQRAPRILLVRADPVKTAAIRGMIRECLPEVVLHEATGGALAVKEAAAAAPDLVMMDLALHEPGPGETTRMIRTAITGRYLPVIAVATGNAQPDWDTYRRAGMNEAVVTPLGADALRAVLARWLFTLAPPAPEQYVDMETLGVSAGHDEAFEQELLAMAVEGVEESVEKLRLHVWEEDRAAIQSLAHKLKGTASAVGFSEIARLAARLEKMQGDPEGAAGLVTGLEGEFALITRILGAR
jgi:CheY-like chemotaxis protein/HPt (histidine-containing phosphotransfer) domain-containing protein